MYKRRRRKGIKEEKVDIKRQDEGAGGAFMHRGEDGSQARKTTTPALVKMPKIKIKSVDKKIPLFESHRSALFPSVCVCVYVCVRFHSVNSSISPTRGITKNKKRNLLPCPRKQAGTQF
jgi:hypothetical protein